MKKGIRSNFGDVFRNRSTESALQKLEVVQKIMELILSSVSAVFDPCYVELAICILQIKSHLATDGMGLLSEKILAIPCFAAYKGKIKGIFPCFGNSTANVLAFTPVRSLYVLAGLQAARDEIDLRLPDSNGNGNVVVLDEIRSILSNAFSILRRVAPQVSTIDIEFAEENPWCKLEDAEKTAHGEKYVS